MWAPSDSNSNHDLYTDYLKNGTIYFPTQLETFNPFANADSPNHSTISSCRRAQQRAVRRVRATNDPLLLPSRAHQISFAAAAAKRTECGMLNGLGDAIASSLPRVDTHMINVKADSDIIAVDAKDGIHPYRSMEITSAASFHQRSTSLLPTYRDKNLDHTSFGTSSSLPPLMQLQQHPPPRTIKMIRHWIKDSDSLTGIAVRYGIQVSQLQRLNRLWQSTEIATRDCLYIPLRMCLSNYTVAYIEDINQRYRDELRNKTNLASTISPIDIIEVVLDASPGRLIKDPLEFEEADAVSRRSRHHPWPVVYYQSIERYFSFTL